MTTTLRPGWLIPHSSMKMLPRLMYQNAPHHTQKAQVIAFLLPQATGLVFVARYPGSY